MQRYGYHPVTRARSYLVRIRKLSAVKDVDHELSICDVSDVWEHTM